MQPQPPNNQARKAVVMASSYSYMAHHLLIQQLACTGVQHVVALVAAVAKVEEPMMEEVARHLESTVGWCSQHCAGEILDARTVELELVEDSETVCKTGHSQA